MRTIEQIHAEAEKRRMCHVEHKQKLMLLASIGLIALGFAINMAFRVAFPEVWA